MRKWLTMILVFPALVLVACVSSPPEERLSASFTPQAAIAEKTQVYPNGSLIKGRDVYEGVPVEIQVSTRGLVQVTFQDSVLLYFWLRSLNALSGVTLGQRTRFVIERKIDLDRWEDPLSVPGQRSPTLFEGF